MNLIRYGFEMRLEWHLQIVRSKSVNTGDLTTDYPVYQ